MKVLSQRSSLQALGGAHGAVDFVTAWALTTVALNLPFERATIVVLVYNLVASGAQVVVADFADRALAHRKAALLGIAAVAVGAHCSALHEMVSITVLGLGSALFHVGAGALAVLATPRRASGLSIFSAPGIMGLALGATSAMRGDSWAFGVGMLALVLSGLLIARVAQHPPPEVAPTPRESNRPLNIAAVLLLIAIGARSSMWNGIDMVATNMERALLVAIAAGTGKLLGGVLADRIGRRRAAVGALILATPCLASGPALLAVWLTGVALLQSTIPSTFASIADCMPDRPGRASALALGVGILLGAVPLLVGFAPALCRGVGALATCAFAALCLALVEQRRGPRARSLLARDPRDQSPSTARLTDTS